MFIRNEHHSRWTSSELFNNAEFLSKQTSGKPFGDDLLHSGLAGGPVVSFLAEICCILDIRLAKRVCLNSVGEVTCKGFILVLPPSLWFST